MSFEKSKIKIKAPRKPNPVHEVMITMPRRNCTHKDRKREEDRNHCRKPIKEDE